MSSDPRVLQARALHQRGDLDNAIRSYEVLLAEQPADATLWHLKGMAEHQAGRLEAAHASAERAIASGGEQPQFLYLQGGVHHDRGALAEADACYARAAAAKPGLLDLAGGGRLATGVKKGLLFGAEKPGGEEGYEDPDSEGQNVRVFTLEWAAM